MTIHQLKPNATLILQAPLEETARGGRLLSALLSWWRYRVRPPLVPARLREDLGLPPDPDMSDYDGVPIIKPLLLVLWRA